MKTFLVYIDGKPAKDEKGKWWTVKATTKENAIFKAKAESVGGRGEITVRWAERFGGDE